MIVRAMARAQKRAFHETAAYVLRSAASSRPLHWWRRRSDESKRDVGAAWTKNCAMTDPGLATIEISSIHDRKRSTCRSSATYHLVISFAPGEDPDIGVLKQVEQYLLSAIGLEHHPRISAYHIDSDHRHLHALVSRVDPISDRVIVPSFDHRRLMHAARTLEDELGLVKTYHGEFRGCDPDPFGPRAESRNPFLGEVDPLLAARQHARFALAQAERISMQREALLRQRLDLDKRKAAILAEEVAAAAVIKQSAAAQPSDVAMTLKRLRAGTGDLRRQLVELGEKERKEIRVRLSKLNWLPWLEAEAARGDPDAGELLGQLGRRAETRRRDTAEAGRQQGENTRAGRSARHLQRPTGQQLTKADRRDTHAASNTSSLER
jgi:hypothetical protein